MRVIGLLLSQAALGIVIEYDIDEVAFAAVGACDDVDCDVQPATSIAGIIAESSFFFMAVVYMVIKSSSGNSNR